MWREKRLGEGRRLLGFKPRATLSTAHDRAHKRKETLPVFCRRHRTNLMLYAHKEEKISNAATG